MSKVSVKLQCVSTMSKQGPSKENDQDEQPQIQRKTTTDQQVADQAMRRAVYSDVRKKRSSSSMRSERGSVFSKVASAIVESVRGVQNQQRVVEALRKLMADSAEDLAEDLSIGEWSEVAKSLLGCLDAIFYKLKATSDPDHTKHLYKTLEQIIENVQHIDELLEKISKLSSHLENNMDDARTQFASTDFHLRDLLAKIGVDLEGMKNALKKHLSGQEAEEFVNVLHSLSFIRCKSLYKEARAKHSKAWEYIAAEHLKNAEYLSKENRLKEKEWCWKCWNFSCCCSRKRKVYRSDAEEQEIPKEFSADEIELQLVALGKAQGSSQSGAKMSGADESHGSLQGGAEVFGIDESGADELHGSLQGNAEASGIDEWGVGAKMSGADESQGSLQGSAEVSGINEVQGSGTETDPSHGNHAFQDKSLLGKIDDVISARRGSQKNAHESVQKQSVLAQGDVSDLTTGPASSMNRKASQTKAHASVEEQRIPAQRDISQGMRGSKQNKQMTPDDKGQESLRDSASVSLARDRSLQKAAPSLSFHKGGRLSQQKPATRTEQDYSKSAESNSMRMRKEGEKVNGSGWGSVVEDSRSMLNVVDKDNAYGGFTLNASNLDAGVDPTTNSRFEEDTRYCVSSKHSKPIRDEPVWLEDGSRIRETKDPGVATTQESCETVLAKDEELKQELKEKGYKTIGNFVAYLDYGEQKQVEVEWPKARDGWGSTYYGNQPLRQKIDSRKVQLVKRSRRVAPVNAAKNAEKASPKDNPRDLHYLPLVPVCGPSRNSMTPRSSNRLVARRKRDALPSLADIMELERRAMSQTLSSDCFVNRGRSYRRISFST